MKLYISVTLILIQITTTLAQNQSHLNREQLRPLNYFIGNWKGTATIRKQDGSTITVNQEEKITWQLDSLLLNFEGIGKDPVTNKQSFHAFALVFYNPDTKQLGMKSFTHEGQQTDAYFTVVSENKFEWGFDLKDNRGKIKYTITLSPKDRTWFEQGEFSSQGNQWYPFMTLNLIKQ
ncbi:MAG: hypothetical protein JNM78_18085 [Cyclobacteriaceae bacterium]|nr:hypothetical protein [Cyclobacteriaceae bacterium]